MIYDLGGGTFDVSILEIGVDVFEVLATSGDTFLGGDDFDDKIMEYLRADFQRQHGIDLSQDLYALQAIKEAAEQAKKAFSTDSEASVYIPSITSTATGERIDYKLRLSRQDFNKMVVEMLQRTFLVCDEAMATAKLDVSDIDGVILVGGPTRLPIVRNAVSQYFQREPNINIDPDLVVAMGAAIQADALLDNSTTTFLDVTRRLCDWEPSEILRVYHPKHAHPHRPQPYFCDRFGLPTKGRDEDLPRGKSLGL